VSVCNNGLDDDEDGDIDAEDVGCEDATDDNEDARPIVSGLSPDNGLAVGGAEITLTGERMSQELTVRFGDTPASTVALVDDTTVVVEAPALTPGVYTVYVTSEDGTYEVASPYVATTATGSSLDDVRLELEAELTLTVDVAEELEAWVLEGGVTDAIGQGTGIMAEAGYGPEGTDPTADVDWAWADATWASDSGDGQYDVYHLFQSIPQAGRFAFTFRFTVDGIAYAYADRTGLSDGFDPSALTTLVVGEVP